MDSHSRIGEAVATEKITADLITVECNEVSL